MSRAKVYANDKLYVRIRERFSLTLRSCPFPTTQTLCGSA